MEHRMPTFANRTLSPQKADAFEAQLRAAGYSERPSATEKTLQPHEYFKRTGSSDPTTFTDQPVVTLYIRN